MPPFAPAVPAARRPDERADDPPWVDAARRPGVVRRVLRTPARAWGARDLVGALVRRELGARFRGTALGWAWPFVHPLALFAAYGFVFSELLGMRLPGGAAAGPAFALYLLVGTLVWSAFAEATARGTTALVDGRHLVRKHAFPAEALPLVQTLAPLFSLSIGAALLVAGAAALGWPSLGPRLAWVPVLAALQLALTLGLAWGLAALHVALRDTAQLVAVGLAVAMLATPIFWVPSVEALPALEPWLGLVDANPLHHLVLGWRSALLGGEPGDVLGAPVGATVLRLAPWCAGALLVGRALLAAAEDHLADEL